MKKKKIYVYAISKNEEKFAKRWYESVKSADGIYVLDTGSTDNTVKILKELGAKVTTKEEAEVTRIDNNSNIVAFGEKTSFEDALAIVKIFITTEFSNLEKHQRRIDKITAYEENN